MEQRGFVDGLGQRVRVKKPKVYQHISSFYFRNWELVVPCWLDVLGSVTSDPDYLSVHVAACATLQVWELINHPQPRLPRDKIISSIVGTRLRWQIEK